MMRRNKQSRMSRVCRVRISLRVYLLVLALLPVVSGLLVPQRVFAGACEIAGPGNVSGEVGTPISNFYFTGSNNNGVSKMVVNFSWVPSTVPGITSSASPAAGTTRNTVYTFSGTPTVAGNYSYTATAHDNAEKCTDSSTTGTVTISPPPVLQILNNTLPNGQVGTAYSASLSGSGGSGIYTWSATGLPAGLVIAPATGAISGTPTGPAGDYTLTITITDTLANTASKPFTVTIIAAVSPLAITTLSLPAGQVNIPYSYTVSATGGTPGYAWSWAAASLPPGLTFSAGGVISGTPTTANTYNITITVRDAAGSTASATFALTISAAPAVVVTNMTNYCVTPPFIQQETLPNLLLLVDNSASMFDIFFIDKGSSTRDPYYCYDNTFISGNPYPGYFDETKIYRYNDATFRFEETGSFPAACDKQVPSSGSAASLCLKGNFTTKPYAMTDFYANGKYLNWLGASKFDLQKQILTGGKYDLGNSSLIAESRGCVGRRYLKEALVADYSETGTNTSLGITFGIHGPIDQANPSAPSPGGQTYIDVFVGDYDQGTCQTAIDLYQDPSCNQLCRRNATSACLKYDSNTTTLDGKISNVFIQSVQECYQFDLDGTVGTDAANTVKNQCPDVLDGFSPGKCSVTTTTSCAADADCPASERCKVGPFAIEPGSAALLCGSSYTGACYVGAAPYSKFGYTGTVTDSAGTTYTGDDCITYMHNKFCGDIKQPPVIDPTDDPSATDLFANTPAILGDVGVQGQLGSPVKSMLVRVASALPTGIIQDYKKRLRFGALSFNFNGSPTECSATDLVKCPRVCSNDKTKVCTSFQDCPPASPAPTCDLVTSANMYRDPVTNQLRGNEDGGHVISYIGDPTYAANPVGDHSSGLIRSLDDVRAQTWTPFAEGFYTSIAYYNQNTNTGDATKPHRLNTTDFSTGIATAPNPVLNTCQRNHILLITDGMSTTDQNAAVMSLVGLYNDGDGNVTTTASASGASAPKYFGSQNIDDLAWFAQHKNITNPSSTATIKNSEKVRTDVVYSGEPCADKAADGITCTSTSEVIPERLMQQTAANGGGTYHLATNQPQFRTAIQAIFEDIAGSASSGTAASVLASGEGSGANLIQAVFYPRREFDGTTEGRWLGRLTNLWYYVDPRFSSSGIYDDSGGGSSQVLNVTDDKLVTLYYDATAKQAKAHRVDDINDDGVPETPITPDINVEDLANLWDGGVKLWKRTSARKILTSVGSGLIDFSSSSAATLRPYLQAADNTEATNIINYVNGTDIAGYRSRTVTINATTTDAGTHSGTWKLGDIIQSTPRIAARFPLNNYYDTYRDDTYNTFYTDSAYGYTNRGIVFAGANDGMLHAFYLGKLELSGVWKTSALQKAQLSDPSGIGLGKEIWGFIPKNVLPYLKYYTDTSYCHLYSVDLTPTIVDVAIGEPAVGDVSSDVKTAASWRTVLIGGMRLGGACKRSDDGCTDCVKTPGVDLNSNGAVDTDAEKTVGLSSYFALDITDTLAHPDDPANYPPVLLWEYTDEDLGFSTSGPTIVKINVKSSDFNTDGHFDTLDPSDTTKNGKYFVAFGSGPTGGISTADHQFLGKSMQELRIFVLDLKSGTLIRKIDTGVSDAFAGSMVNASLDVDLDYQDDVVYIPYTRKCTVADTLHPCTSGTWTNGGVLRLLTKEDLNPANWTFSTVIDGSGAVTASVGKLLNTRKHQLWIFFGSGRYFFEQTSPDDPTNQRQLYGLKDPCYGIAGFDLTSCPSVGSLRNVTNIANVIANVDTLGYNGWYINMANAGSGYRAEREITDPLASISGFVLFTTFQPKDDNCAPGGRSFIWAVKYDSGGAPGAALKGKGLLQVSTGSIEEVNLASRFTEEGGRKTTAIEGVPPTAQGLSILATPPPVKRTIHIKER